MRILSVILSGGESDRLDDEPSLIVFVAATICVVLGVNHYF